MTLSELLQIRQKGKQPALMVILSLVGPLAVANLVIDVRGRFEQMDFRGLAGLDVEIAGTTTQVERVADLCQVVSFHEPRILTVSLEDVGKWFYIADEMGFWLRDITHCWGR